MNKAFLKLHEYRLSESDLSKMSPDQHATFAVLCYAISELNCLQKMSLFSMHDIQEEPEIGAAWAIQAQLLLRTISSKLFELRELLTFTGKYNKTKDPDLLKFGEVAKRRLCDLDGHDGYEIARRVRHDASFHYKLKPARQRIEVVQKTAMRSLYMHEMAGNQFFPYGEETMFVGLINEIVEQASGGTTARDVIEKWADWSAKSIRTANVLFLDFFEAFVEPRTPDRVASPRHYWVDPSLVGTLGDDMIPVFLRQE